MCWFENSFGMYLTGASTKWYGPQFTIYDGYPGHDGTLRWTMRSVTLFAYNDTESNTSRRISSDTFIEKMASNTVIKRRSAGAWSASSPILRALKQFHKNSNEFVEAILSMLCLCKYRRMKSIWPWPTTKRRAPKSMQNSESFKRLESLQKCTFEQSKVSLRWLSLTANHSSSFWFSNLAHTSDSNFSSSFFIYNDSSKCEGPLSFVLSRSDSILCLNDAIRRFKICFAIDSPKSSVQFLSWIT